MSTHESRTTAGMSGIGALPASLRQFRANRRHFLSSIFQWLFFVDSSAGDELVLGFTAGISVPQRVRQINPAMGPNLHIGDLSRLQQLHHSRTGHTQEISDLAGGQLARLRPQRHSQPLTHRLNRLTKHRRQCCRQLHRRAPGKIEENASAVTASWASLQRSHQVSADIGRHVRLFLRQHHRPFRFFRIAYRCASCLRKADWAC